MTKRQHDRIAELESQLAAQVRANKGLQARIDSLMLEYCPDEMTPEQIEEWGRHQVPVSPEEEAAIRASLTGHEPQQGGQT